MNNFEVSLVIPCYNANNYLKNVFKSIENQTFGINNIEIIFVYDTNSTDNSLLTLKSFKNEYPHIKLIEYDNPLHTAGLPRNEGLKHVTSDYVIFLDSDDTLEHDAVEVLYNTIVDYNVDIVKSNFSLLVNGEKIKLNFTSDKPIIIKPCSEELSKITDDIIWATIYDMNFLKENHIQFSSSLLGEDTLFIANCLVSTKKNIVLLENYHSVVYTSDNFNSHSHTVTLEKLEDNIKTHREIIDLFLDTNQSMDLIQNSVKRFILNSISNILRSNESSKNKRIMINFASCFINDYEEITPSFGIFWNIFYIIFKKNEVYLILVLSFFVRIFFNSKSLSKLQLFIRKRGWSSLKLQK